MLRAFVLLAVSAVVGTLAFIDSARADDTLDSARERLGRADFSGAIALYDRAAAGSGLTRADVIELLAGRALAEHAARRTEDAELTLVALLSLEPTYQLDETTPPSLRRACERLRATIVAPLGLSVEATPIPDGSRIATEVTNDPARLVRLVRVHVRRDDGWHVEEGESVALPHHGALAYFVEVIGPGGAALASSGSENDPRVVRGAVAGDEPITAESGGGAASASSEQVTDGEGGDDPWPFVALGIGGALAVAGAIVLVVLLTSSGQGTQPSAPMEVP